jgi:hypothetical protein
MESTVCCFGGSLLHWCRVDVEKLEAVFSTVSLPRSNSGDFCTSLDRIVGFSHETLSTCLIPSSIQYVLADWSIRLAFSRDFSRVCVRTTDPRPRRRLLRVAAYADEGHVKRRKSRLRWEMKLIDSCGGFNA